MSNSHLYLQVIVELGGHHYNFLKHLLLHIPFFEASLKFGTKITVPDLTEFRLTITREVIMELSEFHSGWRSSDCVPPTYQSAMQCLRVADFLGDVEYIDSICKMLGVQKQRTVEL